MSQTGKVHVLLEIRKTSMISIKSQWSFEFQDHVSRNIDTLEAALYRGRRVDFTGEI